MKNQESFFVFNAIWTRLKKTNKFLVCMNDADNGEILKCYTLGEMFFFLVFLLLNCYFVTTPPPPKKMIPVRIPCDTGDDKANL